MTAKENRLDQFEKIRKSKMWVDFSSVSQGPELGGDVVRVP